MKRIILATTALLWTLPVGAAQEPQWEAGVGIGMTTLPDYRGADEGHTYVLPIPYLSYRSDKVTIDRRGVRGDLARIGDIWLDVSASLGPPAKSEDNSSRTDMRDLDPTFEIGPSVRWLLYHSERRDRFLTLHLPLRGVIATDFRHVDYIGAIFAPNLNFDVFNVADSGWAFGIAFGPLYASEKYHDYYYQVNTEFATATRPAYDARAGYSGSRLTLAMSKRYPRMWFGMFVRYDNLHGAVFEDSPLMKRNHSVMAGFGLSYILARSETMVDVGDNPRR